ncbi:DUF2630 family protein [Longispora sp. NPDC051575]|uniref:DUF2630 family protein n=1 Tax=Longispora sp. NPDC051575 TaxID=3154943 RepID=UPI00341931A2
MDDRKILEHIDALVAEEHELRGRHSHGESPPENEAARLRHLEETLDQTWDLLRRRRALREAGANPDAAKPAPIPEVEGYLQ